MKIQRKISFLYLCLLIISSSCSQINQNKIVGVWELVSYGSRSTMVSSANASNTSIEFTGDGSLNGNVGCNSFNGSYNVAGESIRFEPLVATMMFCMGPVGDQEAYVFSVLQGTAPYKLDGDDLVITSSDGSRSIVLKRK